LLATWSDEEVMAPKIVVPYRREDKLQAYVEAIEEVGLDAVPVHAESGTVPEVMEGLYLTGGSDVNPALYGEDRHALTEEPDEARDALEIGLLRRALSAQLPCWGSAGVCNCGTWPWAGN
jgi:gamma-glutamyl-gamma-aminobutyrate hydrolase PuuD